MRAPKDADRLPFSNILCVLCLLPVVIISVINVTLVDIDVGQLDVYGSYPSEDNNGLVLFFCVCVFFYKIQRAHCKLAHRGYWSNHLSITQLPR